MEVKDIQERINNAIESEKLAQVEEMIAKGKIDTKENIRFVGGGLINIGSTLVFDNGRINLAKSIEIDNIARDIEFLFMREEISELRYDALMDVIK